jgi:hypothetical protein
MSVATSEKPLVTIMRRRMSMATELPTTIEGMTDPISRKRPARQLLELHVSSR